eukprot:TRINITY_DN6142_c0_g1_i1.p1 TRINITY_DN6142_c0_g1~~TRINITY_DN6142_c0_g1_i1.p1  ORF type:complete len:537 (+),score=163.41 TRINITY_DN6142_c0_g1_i1:163-1611(+)
MADVKEAAGLKQDQGTRTLESYCKLSYLDGDDDVCVVVNNLTLEAAIVEGITRFQATCADSNADKAPLALVEVDTPQSYLVYKTTKNGATTFNVRGTVDGVVVATTNTADDAINRAVTLAHNTGYGGTVTIQPGHYPLNKCITMMDRVHLCGTGRGAVLSPASASVGVNGIVSGQNIAGARVSDLSVIVPASMDDEVAFGVLLDFCTDCDIRNVFVAGFATAGISCRNETTLTQITDCKLAGNTNGILLTRLNNFGPVGSFVPFNITNCQVYGGGVGVNVDNGLVINIIGVQVFMTEKEGFLLTAQSNSVLISGCRTFQVGGSAVHVDNTNELNVSSNIFCWSGGHGIHLNQVKWGTITGNNVIDSGSVGDATPDTPGTDAILVEDSEGINITANNIFNWSVAPQLVNGIVVDSTNNHALVVANHVNYFTKEAVVNQAAVGLVQDIVSQAEPSFNAPTSSKRQQFDRAALLMFIQQQRTVPE